MQKIFNNILSIKMSSDNLSMLLSTCSSVEQCKPFLANLITSSNAEAIFQAYERALPSQQQVICKSMKHLFDTSNSPVMKGIRMYFMNEFRGLDKTEQERRIHLYIKNNCIVFMQYILLFSGMKNVSDELISYAEEQGDLNDDSTIVNLLESYNFYTVNNKEVCSDSSLYAEIEGHNTRLDIIHAVTGDFMPFDLTRYRKGERKIKRGSMSITFFPNIYGLALHNIIDEPETNISNNLSWFQESNKYILSIPNYDLYTLHGYTFKGDSIANKYCISYKHHPERELEDSFIAYLKQIVVDSKFHDNYICYFYQFQKIVDVNKNEMASFSNDITQAEIMIITGSDLVNAYREVEKVVKTRTFSKKFWMLVVKLFVDDLERIIDNSPRLSETMEVFRGTKSHYYSNKKDTIYKNQSFTSTSFVPDIMLTFSKPNFGGCCFSKFILGPETKCIWMDPVSKMGEYEILLSPDQDFKIIGKEILRSFSLDSTFLDDSPALIEKEDICKSKYKNVDYTILEQV